MPRFVANGRGQSYLSPLSGAALFLAIAYASSLAPLRAADEPIDRESLRLLDGVRVAIEDLPLGLPKELTKDALTRFIEDKLMAVRVPLQRPGEYSVGDPFLRVTIKTTEEAAGVVGYHIEVDFVQIVFMRRNPAITFNRAQTWAAHPRMGLVPRAQLADRIQKDLDTELTQFIVAYQSVNPQ